MLPQTGAKWRQVHWFKTASERRWEFTTAIMTQSRQKPRMLKPIRIVQLGVFVFSATRRTVIGLRNSVCNTWEKL